MQDFKNEHLGACIAQVLILNLEAGLHPDGRQQREHADAAARGRGLVVVEEVEQHVRAIVLTA
jgi:hypothetical protein